MRDALRICNIMLDDLLNSISGLAAMNAACSKPGPHVCTKTHITHSWERVSGCAVLGQHAVIQHALDCARLLQFTLNEGCLFPDVTEVHAPWPSRDPTWSYDDVRVGEGKPRRLNRKTNPGHLE